MKKQVRLAVMAGAASLLALLPTAAGAQDTTIGQEARRAGDRLRWVREFEGFLREAEAARLKGACDQVRTWYDFFHGTNPNFRIGDGVHPELKEIFQRRIAEIAALDCPPGSGTPSVAPPVAQPTTSSGQIPTVPAPADASPSPTSAGAPGAPSPAQPDPEGFEPILDEIEPDSATPAVSPPASRPDESDPDRLRGRMSAARTMCNRERFEELKRQLIASLDRRLDQATDEFTRGRLQRERELAEGAAFPVPCPPTGPQTVPRTPASGAAPSGAGTTPGTTAPAEPRSDNPWNVFQTPDPTAPSEPFIPRGPVTPVSEPAEPYPWQDGAPGSRVRIGVGGGYGASEIPPANYGFVRNGPAGSAPEMPAAFSEENVGTYILEAGVYLRRLGQLSLSYATGEADTVFSVPVLGNGGASGIVNTDEAPSSSTGVTADFGTSGTTSVSFDSFGAEFRFNLVDRVPGRGTLFEGGPDGSGARPGGNDRFRAFAGFGFGYSERDHLGTVRIAGTTGGGFQFFVNQDLDQQVTEFTGSLLAGVDYAIALGGGVRANVGVEARVIYFNFDLRALETRTQNIGSPPDQSFQNIIDDEEDGFGYGGTVRVGLEGDLSRAITLFIEGRARYTSDRGQIVNPFSGDFVLNGGTTFLATDDAIDVQIMIGLRAAFGAPPR